MEPTNFLEMLMNGSAPFWQKALLFVAPAMIAISLVIDFGRELASKVLDSTPPVPNSPRDHARNLILFLSPVVVGIIWLWAISGTWITIGGRLSLKEWSIGGIFLGIMNTAFYRYFWKPYGKPKIKAILAKWSGQPDIPEPPEGNK